MTRGTKFLAARDCGFGDNARPDPRRARLLGNALRELDQFLRNLADVVDIAGDSEAPHRPRLHALSRSRACLFHCEGVVRRPDQRGGGWMTAGWSTSGAALDQIPLGDFLRPTGADLRSICRFYDRLAADLVSRHHPVARAAADA